MVGNGLNYCVTKNYIWCGALKWCLISELSKIWSCHCHYAIKDDLGHSLAIIALYRAPCFAEICFKYRDVPLVRHAILFTISKVITHTFEAISVIFDNFVDYTSLYTVLNFQSIFHQQKECTAETRWETSQYNKHIQLLCRTGQSRLIWLCWVVRYN